MIRVYLRYSCYLHRICCIDSDDVEAALKEIDEEEKGILQDSMDQNSKDSKDSASSSEPIKLNQTITKETKEFSSSEDSGNEKENTGTEYDISFFE